MPVAKPRQATAAGLLLSASLFLAPGATSSGTPALIPPASHEPAGTKGPGRPNRGGLVAGRVSAIGDSVLLDYAGDLARDLRGVEVTAAVGRQWSSGVAAVRALRARRALGMTVVVALGTNGPVTPAAFEAMRRALAGVRRVVFVTVHVDQPWQASVNAVLRAGAATMRNARIADWYRLSSAHPRWFYPDRTHLPIGGPGARALAALVARAVEAR